MTTSHAGTDAVVLDQASARPQADIDVVRNAFRQRAAHAVDYMARFASVETLARALEAPTAFGAMAVALGGSAMPAAALELDPMADALARGAGERERLAARAGGLLSAADIGRLLGGISRQAVDKRRRANQLLAVNLGGDWRYPAVQIGGHGTVPALLPATLRAGAEAGLSGWAMLDFLLAADGTLGGLSPLQALAGGGAKAGAVGRLLRASDADAFG